MAINYASYQHNASGLAEAVHEAAASLPAEEAKALWTQALCHFAEVECGPERHRVRVLHAHAIEAALVAALTSGADVFLQVTESTFDGNDYVGEAPLPHTYLITASRLDTRQIAEAIADALASRP